MATIIQNPPTQNPNPEPDPELTDGKQMSFLEHLEELRKRLLRSVYALIIASGVGFYFRDYIYAYLSKPLTDSLTALHQSPKLAYLNREDTFSEYIKLAIVAGVILASPIALREVWSLISPGHVRHQKKYV